MSFGKWIKELRDASALTQQDLANVLGVTVQAVSQWENDKTVPDTRHLLALLEHLKAVPPVSGSLKMHMQEETVVEVNGNEVCIQQEDRSSQMGTQFMSFKGGANLDAFIGMLTEARKAIA